MNISTINFTSLKSLATKGKGIALKTADRMDTFVYSVKEYLNSPYVLKNTYKKHFNTDNLTPAAIERKEHPLESYKQTLQKITSTPFFKCANEESQKLLTEYFNSIGKSDPLRLKRIAESKIMQTTFDKIDGFAKSIHDTKLFFSKNMTRMSSQSRYLREYPKNTPLSTIKKHIKNGEVCSIAGKAHVQYNGKLIPLKLSKEMFEKLFPPNKLFNFKQGEIGDCWFISGLSGLLDKPKGRLKIYQMFEQKGNDVIVNIDGYKSQTMRQELKSMFTDAWKKPKESDFTTYKFTFKNAEPLTVDGIHGLDGVKGLQMLEQAFAVKWNGILSTNVNMNEQKNMKKVLYALNGGTQQNLLANILKYVNDGELIKTVDGKEKGEIWKNLKYAHQILKKHSKNEDTMLFAATKSFRFRDDLLSKKYHTYSDHAYTIRSYNDKNQIVYLANPHYDKYVIEMPLSDFKEYFSYITAVKL